MTTRTCLFAALSIALSCNLPSLGQNEEAPKPYEVAGTGGFAFGTGLSVERGTASGKTGFENGFAAGGLVGHNSGRYLGGEVRYLFRGGAARLDVGGSKASLSSSQHAITYDVIWHLKQRGYQVRPFVSGGGGMKWVRGTGMETAAQPGSAFLALTATSQVVPAFGGGAGVKVRVNDRTLFRFEVRDLISTAPTQVLAPAPGASVKGLFHDLMFLVSVAYRF
jgi:hypothetical protein